MSWFKKPALPKPQHYWVASNKLDYITGKGYIDFTDFSYSSASKAQELADEWTSRFQRYYWVVDDQERDAEIAKQKTAILEKELGIK